MLCFQVPGGTGPKKNEFKNQNPNPPKMAKQKKTDLARAGPGRDGPSRAKTSQAEPSQARPSQARTGRAEPGRADPSRAATSRAKPRRAGPSRAETSRAKPSRTELGGAGLSRVEPSRAELRHKPYFPRCYRAIVCSWFFPWVVPGYFLTLSVSKYRANVPDPYTYTTTYLSSWPPGGFPSTFAHWTVGICK